eukprot:1382574-Rhodomonas_salina.2
MKASDHCWRRTIHSSPQAAATPDWELTPEEDGSQCSTHHDTATSPFNFFAPPGGYSLKGLAILKELVCNSVINSRAAEEAQMNGERLWTACALQLSSAFQWPARRLFITGVEATVCLHVPVPLPFSNFESLQLSLPSLAEDNFPLHAQNAATGTLF